MKLTFLGTGTSTGVPQMGCRCDVCTSSDPRDKRLRSSVLVEAPELNLLIDSGPDLREQLLRLGTPPIDAMVITHSHYDHVGGIDDLRPYCFLHNGFPVYCREDVSDDLHARVPYCFSDNPYPGVPSFKMHVVDPYTPFEINGVKVTPLPVLHLRLPILGYRVGNVAYITDCKLMPESTVKLIRGIDTLVINSLRLDEHPSHMNLSETLHAIKRIGPRCAYLTHLSHGMGMHAKAEKMLPKNVHIAYDGLMLDIPD